MKTWKMALAAMALAWTNAAIGGPLRIVTIHGPPWGYLDNGGKPTGMMYDIGSRIAEVAGLQYTNALVPYPRTALEIENGTADVVLRFGNEQMLRAAIPVASVVAMPIILVGPRGTQYRQLSELHGKTVGVIRTSNYVKEFDTDQAIQKYAVTDYAVMAKMLAARRLDAGVGSDAGFYYGAHAAGIRPDELGTPLVLGQNDFILFFSKKTATPDTMQALKEAVRKMTASGEIRQIMSKYNVASLP